MEKDKVVDEKVLKKREYNRNRYHRNKESIKTQVREYRNKNIEKVRKRENLWHKNNREYLNEYRKGWVEKNKDALREYKRDYHRSRRDKEPHFRIADSLRARCRNLLKGKSKAGTSEFLVGCSWIELKVHLEKNFQPGMTWENYGKHGWHIDHIRPLAHFNLECPEQQKEAFHYSNLQPLWAMDNLKKGAKYR